METSRRRYITLGLALVCGLAGPSRPMDGQARVVERHTFDESEGRLLAFYSASMAFSPAGILPGSAPLTVALELSHVPWLNEEQRRPSIDKPEATNLAPLFPRPRVSVRLGHGLQIEGSWIPPLRVFDVRANLASLALTGPAGNVAGFDVTPRIWGTTGRVRGAMTCAASAMLGKGSTLEIYYAAVCHGHESDDWFEPRMLGGELLVARALAGATVRAYAGLGARIDHTRFNIGVLTADGERDPDHPILELRATRPHFVGGAAWTPGGRWAAGAEAFYAPGSLLTVRASGRWTVRS